MNRKALLLAYVLTAGTLFLQVLPQTSDVVFWADWTSWSSCLRRCDVPSGKASRNRMCFQKKNRQKQIVGLELCEMNLAGSPRDDKDCYETACQGNGLYQSTWGEWNQWMPCSFLHGYCGSGVKIRIRMCPTKYVSSGYGGMEAAKCPGGEVINTDEEQDECYQECPRKDTQDKYGGWSDWGEWVCTQDCEPGVMSTRSRVCDNPPPLPDYTCPGLVEETAACEGKCFQAWGDWSAWTSCTMTCDAPLRQRTRQCEGIGEPCQGDAAETKPCIDSSRHELCPTVNGGWSVWTFWSDECSVTCNEGVHVRTRLCNNPKPSGLGQDCPGSGENTKVCLTHVQCPVNGTWNKWSPWMDCTATCGEGQGYRSRNCTPPKYGGLKCRGQSDETGVCILEDCPLPTLPPDLQKELQHNLDQLENNLEKSEGDSVTMACSNKESVQDVYSDALVAWEQNQQPVTVDGQRIWLDRGSLVFRAVQNEDSGVYVCQLDFGGASKAIVSFYVLSVESRRPDIAVRQNEDLQLTCNGVALGLLFQTTVMSWLKDGQVFKNYGSIRPQEANVEFIPSVTKEYDGTWRCLIQDDATNRKWTTNTVKVKVLPPKGMADKAMEGALGNPKLTGGIAGAVGFLITVVVIVCITRRKKSGASKKRLSSYSDESDEGTDYDDDASSVCSWEGSVYSDM